MTHQPFENSDETYRMSVNLDDSPYPRIHHDLPRPPSFVRDGYGSNSGSPMGSRRQSMVQLNSPHMGAAAAGAGATAGGFAALGSPYASHTDLSRLSVANSYDHDMIDDTDIDGKSPWLRKQQKRSMWTRWAIIAAIFLAVLGIVGGVVGAQIVKNKSTTNASSSSSSSSNSSSPSNANSINNSTGTITIKPDSRLKKSFYGMCYTPLNSQYPACGVSQHDVLEDIALLSQLTPRIRLYGMDCNVSSLVLNAIQQLNVNMSVFLGVWVDGNQTTLDRQMQTLFDTLKTYGASNVDGITVGNEVIFSEYATSTQLSQYITNVKTQVKSMNLGKTLLVGTADLGSNWQSNSIMAQNGDYVMANVHPYFGNVSIDKAANWTWQFLQDNDVVVAEKYNKPTIISEVGWPTGNKDAVPPIPTASTSALQQFLDTFVCQSNSLGYQYYYFEAFDEPWKISFNDLETHWGLFDSKKNLKDNIKIPDCPVA